MAVNLNPALKYRTEPLLSKTFQFKRRREKIKTKKIQRKIRLKFIHILLTFLFLGGIFFLIQQIYLFLISWDHLDVKGIEIASKRAAVKEEIQEFFEGKNFGNILLLDIGLLQELLEGHRWVENVCVRKIFPSSLRIEIKERTPVAVLKKENFYLIDKEGILLEKINFQENQGLPLLVDSNNFKKDYKDKIALAWECLESFIPSERKKVEILDLTDYENVTLKLKGSETNFILGAEQFSQKLKIFQKWHSRLEKYEPLEYVDLRFQDRLYIKSQKSTIQDLFPNSEKEAR